MLVSICCVTYNHVNYIRQCLDGFVAQQTNFPFEILVHDDASTDGTTEIVREYELKYPHLFRNVYQFENQFLKQNTLHNFLFKMAMGKFISLCEGDDYWTDPLKLQKQVDFLEQHPELALCFHAVDEEDNSGNISTISLHPYKSDRYFTIEELAVKNFIHTASVLFKRNLIQHIPEYFAQSPVGDYPLFMLLASHGNMGYLHQCMAVYRRGSGMWSTIQKNDMYLKWSKMLALLQIAYNDRPEVLMRLLEQHLWILFQLYNETNGEKFSIFNTKENIPSEIKVLEARIQDLLTRDLQKVHWKGILIELGKRLSKKITG